MNLFTQYLRPAKILLLSVMFGFLFIPLLAISVHTVFGDNVPKIRRLFMTNTLWGVTVAETRLPLNADTWLSKQFQDKCDKWFSQTFPSREYMIRGSNQFDYSLFSKSVMAQSSIIVGRDKVLYEEGYVKEYLGLSPKMPPADLERQIRGIADLQKRLRLRNKAFILLITPSKAVLYPQFLPSSFPVKNMSTVRNYDLVVPLLNKYNVVYIDGPKILADAKSKSKVPLYCQGATHWNELGASFVVDEIVHRVSSATGLRLAQPKQRNVRVDQNPEGEDRDLADLLNLLSAPVNYPTPHIDFERSPTKPTGHIIVIGGSFCWMPLSILSKNETFRSMDFYYYWTRSLNKYQAGVKEKKTTTVNVKNINWNEDILSADAVILEINESVFADVKDTHYKAFVEKALSSMPDTELK